MSIVVSAVGVHCVGPQRNGYGPFIDRIDRAGRRLSIVKVRDDFGAVDEPLKHWPDVLCIGTKTNWDGGPFDAQAAYQLIVAAHATKPAIREWEYLNEIDGIYSEQADLYIALLPLLAPTGLTLVMFNCASGTPQYPPGLKQASGLRARIIQSLRGVRLAQSKHVLTSYLRRGLSATAETPYQAIARACKFAKDNGYKARLGLHEYWTGTIHTIGRFKVLADYLTAQNALIPIVITEWLYETHPGDSQFMRGVIENDPVYMTDPRRPPVATWTLGGGGWQGSNYETALDELGEYIATVEEPQVPFVFGVHSTASPGPMLAGDAAGITTAAKFTGYKFMTGDPPEHYAQIAALGIPPANCITRLFRIMNPEEPKPTPEQFCDGQRLAIQEAMAAGVIWFEIHNEPNLTSEWPYSTDPHDFISWCLQVVALLRAQHPGIKLITPGLSPQPNTPQWWTDFAEHGLFDTCDAIGAHVYWPNRATMLTQAQGLNFIPLEAYASTSKPIFITEYANNINGDTDFEKGAQYVDWAAYIQERHPLVTRAYCYIISSNTPADNTSRQTIVRGGVVSQIANGIRDTTPSPGVRYRFEHSHLDGGPADTSNPRVITMDMNHTLLANFTAVTPPQQRFFLMVTIDPPGAGGYTLNPPQPAEGYLAGTSVTVSFYEL